MLVRAGLSEKVPLVARLCSQASRTERECSRLGRPLEGVFHELTAEVWREDMGEIGRQAADLAQKIVGHRDFPGLLPLRF